MILIPTRYAGKSEPMNSYYISLQLLENFKPSFLIEEFGFEGKKYFGSVVPNIMTVT